MARRLLPGVYEGWIVVAASSLIIMLVGSIFFWGFGAIFNEMIEEFGWSVGATAFAFGLRTEVSGVAAPAVGVIIDRIGTRRVMVLGVLLSALGLALLSLVQSLAQFYAVMVITALATSTSGYPVCFAATATWFHRRRSTAMSAITIGGAIGGFFALVVGQLVVLFGWRGALQVLALFVLAVGVVIAMNVRSRPEEHAQPLDGDRASALRDGARPAALWGVPVWPAVRSRPFILMSLGVIALSFATNAIVVHQIPFLEKDLQVSKPVAAGTIAVFSVVSLVGRLGIGVLADRFSKRLMLALTAVLTAVGMALLAVADSFALAMAGVLVIAPAFGGLLPVRPAILADYYGTRHFGTINGIAMLVTTTGGALGPWVVGRAVDVTGSYAAAWVVCALAALAAVPLLLFATAPDALIARHRAPEGMDAAPAPAEAS